MKRIIEKNEERASLNEQIWNKDVLKKNYQYQVIKLEESGYNIEGLIQNDIAIINKIFEALKGISAPYPFVICPHSQKHYCLIGIDYDVALGNEPVKKAHSIIAARQKNYFKPEELEIFEKIIIPLFKNEYPEPKEETNEYIGYSIHSTLREHWLNGTSYVNKIYLREAIQ